MNNTSQNHGDDCDESKCTSMHEQVLALLERRQVYSDATEDHIPYDCRYDPGEPLLCDNGFEGHAITDDYYTCCPIGTSIDATQLRRHCGDPKPVLLSNYSTDSMPCDENDRVFARPMKESIPHPDSYVCCDQSIPETIDSYKEEEEEQSLLCDESKCVGRVLWAEKALDCYAEGPGTTTPFVCAGGYVGQWVESEPPIWYEGGLFWFYTCCPPAETNTPPYFRHCSDPMYLDEHDDLECDTEGLPFPRMMTTMLGFRQQYMCCDSLLVENTTDEGLQDEDCVPYYCSDYQFRCVSQNYYGHIEPMGCSGDPDEIFVYPKPLEPPIGNQVLYECCKHPSTKGPYVTSSRGFRSTVGVQLAFSVTGLLFSLVLILGILLPKLTQKLSCAHHQGATDNESKSSSGGRQRTEPKYNSFNLYLVYLALPDVLLNSYLIHQYLLLANQSLDPESRTMVLWPPSKFDNQNRLSTPWNDAVLIVTTAANQYLNAIITYEVFRLLKQSKRAIRVAPPTLKRCSLQALGAYVLAFVPGILRITLDSVTSPIWAAESTARGTWFFGILYFLVCTGLPTMYIGYVCLVIRKEGLLPRISGRLRSLALYFFRIILSFFVVWVPGSICFTTGHLKTHATLYSIGLLLFSIQPVLSTSIALTKMDVRKNVVGLLTCWRRKV